jgi:hypothetical protein
VLMQSRRIDGGTTLDAREAAIQEFNRPNTGEAAMLRHAVLGGMLLCSSSAGGVIGEYMLKRGGHPGVQQAQHRCGCARHAV